MSNPNGPNFNEWFQRNKKTVLIVGAVGLAIAAIGSAQESDSGSSLPQGCGGQNQPACPPQYGGGQGGGGPQGGGMGGGGTDDGGGMGPPAGGGGGIDMDEWRRRQAQDDEEQRRRVRTIREEERCPDGNVVSIHDGC